MQGQKLIGINIFAIVYIIIGLVSTIVYSTCLFASYKLPIGSFILRTLESIAYIIIGIGIVKLKNWARIFLFIRLAIGVFYLPRICFMFMIGAATYVRSSFLGLLAGIIYLGIILASYIYFTRPKVKEQFK